MAENLRSRVARIIAGGAHSLLGKIEDAAPVALLEQSVREVEQITGEVRSELGRIVANRHITQQQHAYLNREHDGLSASGTAEKLHSAESALDRAYQRQTGTRPAGQSAGLAQTAKLKELSQLALDKKISERLLALKAGH